MIFLKNFSSILYEQIHLTGYASELPNIYISPLMVTAYKFPAHLVAREKHLTANCYLQLIPSLQITASCCIEHKTYKLKSHPSLRFTFSHTSKYLLTILESSKCSLLIKLGEISYGRKPLRQKSSVGIEVRGYLCVIMKDICKINMHKNVT